MELLFEELIRSHEVAGPPAHIGAAHGGRGRTPTPPRRHKRELAFWESDGEQSRIAELSAMLAPPCFGAAAPGRPPAAGAVATTTKASGAEWDLSATEDLEAPTTRGDFPSIAPVAISAVAMDIAVPLSPPGGERALRWLVPVSAGVFALGALAAPGVVRSAMGNGPSAAALHALPERADGAESIAAEHTLDIELRADLLALGALAAADVLHGPALAALGPDELSRAEPQAGSSPYASATSRPAGSGPDATGLAAPRGSASPRAWSAAARLAQASGRQVGSKARDEPPRVPDTPAAFFDARAARDALLAAATMADACAGPGVGTQLVPVSVTFAPSGRATVVQVSGALAGTEAGSCVARALRSATIPPFSGQAVTVSRTVRVR